MKSLGGYNDFQAATVKQNRQSGYDERDPAKSSFNDNYQDSFLPSLRRTLATESSWLGRSSTSVEAAGRGPNNSLVDTVQWPIGHYSMLLALLCCKIRGSLIDWFVHRRTKRGHGEPDPDQLTINFRSS